MKGTIAKVTLYRAVANPNAVPISDCSTTMAMEAQAEVHIKAKPTPTRTNTVT